MMGMPDSITKLNKLLEDGWSESDIAAQTAATLEIEGFKNKNRVSAAEKLAEVFGLRI